MLARLGSLARVGFLGRLVWPVLLVGAVGVPVAGMPVSAAGAPGVVAANSAGWRQVWASDFSGSALPGQCTTYDGPHGGQADSYYTPGEVSVSGGLLRLGMRKQPKNGRNYATGGVTCYKITQRYGKFEYRAKVPLGAGIDAYGTLWTLQDVADDNVLIEVLPRPGAQKAYLSSNNRGNPVHATVSGTYSDTFHTYTIEWSPGLLRILIDGTLRLTDRHPGATAKWIGWAVSSGDSLTGEPNSATVLPAEFDVDWVHIFAYVPGAAPTASPTRSTSPSPSPSAVASAVPGTPAPQPSIAASATQSLAPALTTTANSRGGLSAAWLALPAAVVVLLFLGYALLHRRTPGRHAPRSGVPTDGA